MKDESEKTEIQFAEGPDGVVVVRVVGRGTFAVSPGLRSLADRMERREDRPRYVFDLEPCLSLDSTFMGTMAAISMRQKALRGDRPLVVRANLTVLRQLDTLGLTYLLDIRPYPPPEAAPEQFKTAESDSKSRFDQLVHMIESHETLIDAASGNEVRFRGLLEMLGESLERTTLAQQQPESAAASGASTDTPS